jgi:hypothetical protein
MLQGLIAEPGGGRKVKRRDPDAEARRAERKTQGHFKQEPLTQREADWPEARRARVALRKRRREAERMRRIEKRPRAPR